MLSAIATKCWVKAVLPDDKLPPPQEMLNLRYKSKSLASRGTPWHYSKTAHRCDTRRHGRSGDHQRGRCRVFVYQQVLSPSSTSSYRNSQVFAALDIVLPLKAQCPWPLPYQ